MIIDLLNNYPVDEQNKILDVAERWYAHRHQCYGNKIDVYDMFPDAPYLGEDNFDNWFNKIISSNEKEWIEDINVSFERQISLFDNDKKWRRLYHDITLKFLTWLDENNITYCIIKGLLDFEDCLYIKTLQLPIEYYVLFTTNPRYSYLEYAVDNYGWVKYNVATLINDRTTVKVEKVIDWIMSNSLGVIHRNSGNDNSLFFEMEEDAAAIKLRWADF